MRDNVTQTCTQALCWFTAFFSYFKGLSLSDWGVIIGLGMSLIFGLWGAYQQRQRTKLEAEKIALLRDRLRRSAMVPSLQEIFADESQQAE